MQVVDGLARVLLEVQPLDAHRERGPVEHVDDHLALADDGVFVLRDLVALRQVRVEIILPVEDRAQVDLRLQAQARADGLAHAFDVDHRQHARHRRVDEGDVRVGFGAELGGGAGEQLRLGRHLGVNLESDHHLPVAGGAFDEFLRVDGSVHRSSSSIFVEHGLALSRARFKSLP